MAVRLSALRAGRSLPPRKIPDTYFCWRLSRPQGHNAAGRIRSIEKSNDLIGNRTPDLPAYSIEPQPTTLPGYPTRLYTSVNVAWISTGNCCYRHCSWLRCTCFAVIHIYAKCNQDIIACCHWMCTIRTSEKTATFTLKILTPQGNNIH
jgi:hypothetical protein